MSASASRSRTFNVCCANPCTAVLKALGLGANPVDFSWPFCSWEQPCLLESRCLLGGCLASHPHILVGIQSLPNAKKLWYVSFWRLFPQLIGHKTRDRDRVGSTGKDWWWFLFFFLIDLREEDSGAERERHQFVVPLIYAFSGWFLYVPWLGLNSHPWHIGDHALTSWATWPG